MSTAVPYGVSIEVGMLRVAMVSADGCASTWWERHVQIQRAGPAQSQKLGGMVQQLGRALYNSSVRACSTADADQNLLVMANVPAGDD
jgi:hypothetical protein